MKQRILFLLFLPIFLYANNSVLIINSYHKGYDWSDSVVAGIEEIFKRKNNIETNVLYMDSKRVTSQEYYDSLAQLYKVQLKNRKYDLIITVDRFAYDFVLKIYDQFFTDERILTVGIENYSKENTKKYNLEGKVSALLEKRDLKANIDLISHLYPNLKNLYIINDKSLNALHTEPLIHEVMKEHTNEYNLIYLRPDSLEEFEERFSKEQENTAVLFVRLYKNSNGELNKNNKIAEALERAQVPIFITDSIFSGQGAVGGRIVDLYQFGRSSGAMAAALLSGGNASIQVSKDLNYIFDEKKLDQFNISSRNINHTYELINQNLNYFQRNRGFINFIFTISPFLLILIIILFVNIYRRRKVEEDLRQRITVDTVLLNAIESPIFWQNKDGIIVDSNIKFCKLLGVPCSEIYGRRLKDIKESKATKKILKTIEKYRQAKDKNVYYSLENGDIVNMYLMKQAKYNDRKSKTSGIVTIFHDVTHEKLIEIERERNQQFIIQQSKLAEIGEIFSSIAHQWKAPLVEITAIAQENFYANYEQNGENESYVNEIMTQVEYMNNTINDFQAFIMPSNKKTLFNVHEAINSTLDIVTHNIKYNYIEIKIDVDKKTKLEVVGYRNEFMQSFLNIINNAKDELVKKDFKDRKIYIHIYNEEKNVIIRIEDNAGGVDIKNLNKLFNPYFTTKKGGDGIGLYMAKMIIEDKMGGKISVHNTDEGACFILQLGQNQ